MLQDWLMKVSPRWSSRDSEAPNTFYRYLTWNCYAKKLLRDHSFYYSDPKTFNDIHECVVCPEANSQVAGHGNITIDAKNKYQIYCLSKSKNDPLMWAHYANSYKGICLEFQFHADDRHFNQPRKVTYRKRPPIIFDSELRNGIDLSQKVLGYKHSLWSYEKEWRIFKSSESSPVVPFHVQSLKTVYIGPVLSSANIFHEVFEAVTNYNNSNNTNVRLARLRRDSHSYDTVEDFII